MSGRKVARTLAMAIALGLASHAGAQIYFGQAVVVDGDTLDMGEVRFRLFGIDAVEARQTCNRRGDVWNCGEDAATVLRGLIKDKNVSCDQRGSDPYGRVVAVCTANGRDLAQEMVRMGFAVSLPDFTTDYVEWEDLARERGLGIWSSEFQRPSEFRASDPDSIREDRAMLEEEQRREANSRVYRPAQRSSSSGAYFRNCAAARAADAAPIYRGQPGYRSGLDRDGDGIACEPYRGRR